MKIVKTSSGSSSSKPVAQTQFVTSLPGLEPKFMHDMDLTFEKFKSELVQYLDLRNKLLLSKVRDMFADRTAQHDDKLADHDHRLKRVEQKVGLAL